MKLAERSGQRRRDIRSAPRSARTARCWPPGGSDGKVRIWPSPRRPSRSPACCLATGRRSPRWPSVATAGGWPRAATMAPPGCGTSRRRMPTLSSSRDTGRHHRAGVQPRREAAGDSQPRQHRSAVERRATRSDPSPCPGHGTFVHSLAFSPDGTEDRDRRRRRRRSGVGPWTNTAADPLTLSGHDNGVVAVAFSPDGRSVATGGEDGHGQVCGTWPARHDPLFLPHHDGRRRGGLQRRWTLAGDRAARTTPPGSGTCTTPPGPTPTRSSCRTTMPSRRSRSAAPAPERGDSSRWLVTGSRDSTARLLRRR